MSRSDNLRGISAMVISVGFFALMDAAMKYMADAYPSNQIASVRGLASLPLVCGYVIWRGQLASLLRVRWRLHLLRGLLGIVMLPLFVFALREMAMSAVYAIVFVAPLLITMLSVPVLKEKVKPAHWVAIGIGLAGVLVALRPSPGNYLSIGALAVLLAAACYSVSAVVGRLLTRTDSSASLMFWTTIFLAFGAGALAWPDWVPIRAEDWWLVPVLGLTGFFGQLAITQAFRHGQASVVAPFEYTALAWAMALDWLIWSTLPDRYTLLGAAIIIGSGIYLIRHEKAQVATTPA
jgi:drug/metabolite transporter (DMT)-like permease